jgi:Domain of unknown function (DUF4194)
MNNDVIENDLPLKQAPPDLSLLLINLLKGVIYRESDSGVWGVLLQLQSQVRDYVTVLALELVLDESEGYAFLRALDNNEADAPQGLPRLIARRPLSFAVSLLIALLRKKLTEFDANGAETRLVLSLDEIVEIVRVFLPTKSNDARFFDQIESNLNKIVELGFLRKLKSMGDTAGATLVPASYEIKRILKAFVDAQWLSEFDQKLSAYQEHLLNTQAEDKSSVEQGSATESGVKGQIATRAIPRATPRAKPKNKSKGRR